MPRIPYTKRKDGRYYKQIIIGFDENGKRKVKTLYDKDWRKLDKKVREFQLLLDNGEYVCSNMTLGECIKLWWRTKEDLSPSTKYNYQLRLKIVEPILDIELKNLKPSIIQRILDENCKTEKEMKAHSLYVILNEIFKFAIKRDYVNINIVDKIDKPKLKTEKRRALAAEEKDAVEKVIFSSLKSIHVVRYKAMLAILYYTGMRRNEMLSLKYSDINLENNYIYVQRTLSHGELGRLYEKNTTKTEAGVRKIPIISQLKKILTEYMNSINNERDYLFLTSRKTFITNGNFDAIWKNILKKINENLESAMPTNITPHYFRHNYATELIYAGVPLKTVQYIMGHENIDVTMNIYADVRLDTEDVISKLSEHMKRVD